MRFDLKNTVSLAALGACLLTSAGAQQTTAASGPAAETLEIVTVTAEHRSENIQKAPVAIDSVGGDQIKSYNITNLQDLTQLLPSVQFARAGGPFALFFLRGVGSFAANSLSDAAVQVSIDGVPVARQYGTGGQMYDIDRVEVLKGPQGTLSGRNATGGAVNIIANRPDYTDTGYLSAEFGNYGHIQTEGMLNVALGDKVAMRGAFQTIRHSGYLSDGEDDQDSQAGRLQVRFDPTDDLTLILSGDIYHQGGKGGGSVLLDGGYTAGDRVGLTDPRAAAYYTSLGDVPAASNRLFMDGTYGGVKGQMDWTNGIGVLTAIAAFRKNDADSVGISGPLLIDNEHDHQNSFEIREAFDPFHGLQLTAGAYYLDDIVHARFEVDNLAANRNLASSGNTQLFSLSTRSDAVFADATFEVVDHLKLIGGIRYSEDKKTLTGTLTTYAPVSPNNPVTFTPGKTPADPSAWNSTDWRLGAQWDISDRSMVYGTVSTGFHSGGFFLTHDNPAYQPETLKAYTLGTKNRFFDNTLQFNVEAFYWLYKNEQQSAVSFDSHFSTVFQTFNAAASTIKGFEASLQYMLSKDTLLDAQAQYLDSRFDSFSFKEAFFVYSPLSKCFASGAPPLYTVNCSGLRPPNSPAWTINLGVQQTIHLGENGDLIASIHEHYQSATYLAVSYLPTDLQPAYWMGDMSLTYQFPKSGWSVQGFVNNFTDETVMYSTNHAVAHVDTAQLRAPRFFGIKVEKTF